MALRGSEPAMPLLPAGADTAEQALHYRLWAAARNSRGPDRHAALGDFIDLAMSMTGARMGNVQLVDGTGILRIASHRNFRAPFLEFFSRVDDKMAACGAALRRSRRVVVPDVAQSPIFSHAPSLDVMLTAGARSVQSTPLLGYSGQVMGVLSTHWTRAWADQSAMLGSATIRDLDGLAKRLGFLLELRETADRRLYP